MSYRVAALDGERLDRIARAIFGTEGGGGVEALYAVNPSLAQLGDPVPYGTVIVVPESVARPADDSQRQWE